MSKLSADFYLDPDVVQLSRSLLGKLLCSKIDGQLCKAIITETEAYAGVSDKASHAYGGRYTKRTKIMYAKGGHAYVYLCYGIHYLFNVVSNIEGVPHAILIRAIHPYLGKEKMLERRGRQRCDANTFTGPANVTQALGINKDHNGIKLLGYTIWIESSDIQINEEMIISGPRIGIDYAEEDALLPYRFQWKIDQKNFGD